MAFPKLINPKKIKLLHPKGVIAKGKLKNFKGFQRVNLNLEFLKKVIILLEKNDYEAVDLFVKKDCPVQIGSRKEGYIIAPRLPHIKQERYKLEINEGK